MQQSERTKRKSHRSITCNDIGRYIVSTFYQRTNFFKGEDAAATYIHSRGIKLHRWILSLMLKFEQG